MVALDSKEQETRLKISGRVARHKASTITSGNAFFNSSICASVSWLSESHSSVN